MVGITVYHRDHVLTMYTHIYLYISKCIYIHQLYITYIVHIYQMYGHINGSA